MIHKRLIIIGSILLMSVIAVGLYIFVPIPHTINDTYNDATIEFSVDDTVMLQATCYNVTWHVEGIEGVYLNETGRVGQGTETICAEDDSNTQPKLQVIFVDGTEKTYTIDITLVEPPTITMLDIMTASLILGIAVIFWQRPMLESAIPTQIPRLQLVDVAILLLILVLTIIGFLDIWERIAEQSVLQGSDVQHNILNPAMASLNPEIFQNDFLLNNLDVFSLYQTSSNWLFEYVSLPIFGEPLLAVSILTIPMIFIHQLGFYWLGLALTRNRLLIILFLLFINAYVGIPHDEFWGIEYSLLPRIMFQALLPYLILFALVWRDKPKRWIWLMVGSGLLVYVHSVSTPPWGFAIWLGLWLNHPHDWSIPKRFTVMFGLGVVFLATITPFGLNYWFNGAGGRIVFDIDLIMQISGERLTGYYDPISFAEQTFARYQDALRLEWVVIISIVYYVFGQAQQRRLIFHLWVWSVGLILVTVGINWADHAIAERLGRIPLQIDLIRGLRYLVPLILIVPIIGISSALLTSKRSISIVLQVFMVVSIAIISVPRLSQIPEIIQSSTNITVKSGDGTSMFNYIRENVPESASIGIFYVSNSNDLLGIRHSGLRSIAWIRKDGNFLAYADTERLVEWHDHWNVLQGISALGDIDEEERWQRFNQFAQEIGADYIMFPNRAYYRIQDSIQNAGFVFEYEIDSGNGAVLLRLDKPISYDYVNLSEFTRQNNYSSELEVLCDVDGVALRDTNTGEELHIPYSEIESAQSVWLGTDILIGEADMLRLSTVTSTLLKAELSNKGYYIFSLYRCRFNP